MNKWMSCDIYGFFSLANRTFLLTYIQFNLKTNLKQKMSFYLFFNEGVIPVQSYEQLHSLLSNMPQSPSLPSINNVNTSWSLGWPMGSSTGMEPTKTYDNLQMPESCYGQPMQKGMALAPSLKKKRKQRTVQKQIISAKKNSQSNIVNQFYSYFSSREKSEHLVLRSIAHLNKPTSMHSQILSIFYNTIRLINLKRGRKYVNRSMLLNYYTPEVMVQHLPEIKQKVESLGLITLTQLCEMFRKCSYAFLKNVSVSAILTSKRITAISKEQHFKKRRKVLRAVTGN